MEKYVIQINGGITIDVNVSVKNVMYVKKIVSNPATCNWELFIDASLITCDEIIDADVEAKWNDKF